jgi:hypothetical protein
MSNYLSNKEMDTLISFFTELEFNNKYKKRLEDKYQIFSNTINKLRHILIGLQGENLIRHLLSNSNIKYFQVDAIGHEGFIIEIKHQEYFEKGSNCNFDGHGLPLWQVNDRIKFCKKYNLTPILIIKDLKSNKIYYQSLFYLEANEKYITKNNKRVIYPLYNYHELDYKDNIKIPMRDLKGNIINEELSSV